MPELVRKIQDKILSNREIWNAGKGNEVLIALENDKCTFHITSNQGNDITALVASNLKVSNINHNLYQSIDSWLFEVSQSDKENILKLIDNEW